MRILPEYETEQKTAFGFCVFIYVYVCVCVCMLWLPIDGRPSRFRQHLVGGSLICGQSMISSVGLMKFGAQPRLFRTC